MADLTAIYKNNTITEWNNSGIKTFQTSGKYCEDNIILLYNIENQIINRTISGQYINNNVTIIGSYAFYECKSLTSVSFPVCTTIGSSAFAYCSSLTTVSFPVCTTIGSYAFYSCGRLATANFSVCTTINGYTFSNCRSLTTANFPVCTTIGSYAFYSCWSLATVSFPKCTTIDSYAFRHCRRLTSLYLMSTAIVTLTTSYTFASTPIGGYSETTGIYGSIYVPSSLLTSYKAATNWTYFSSRFVGI